MFHKLAFSSIILCFLVSGLAFTIAPQPPLKRLVQSLEKKYTARIGIVVANKKGKILFFHRDNERFKMSSTMKLPLTVFTLNAARRGKINLNDLLSIEQSHLLPGSGKLQYFASRPGLKISYHNLISPMMIISESVSADVILENTGGPIAVQKYLRQKGHDNIFINRSFAEIFLDSRGYTNIPPPEKRTLNWWNSAWQKLRENKDHRIKMSQQFHRDTRDTTTPRAMAHFLLKTRNGRLLQRNDFLYLYRLMQRCETGDHRIRKKIKDKVIVANKTGSWNNALYEYMGDVGYLYHKGQHLIYAVYVEATLPPEWQRGLYAERAFPEIGAAIFNDFLSADAQKSPLSD